ncbi:hypothetical protein EHS17_15180 [Rhodobacteraceae bacterium CH30]|nr:hypothetical protein EHS17_15180 [Rhodobacteraceae bacterium CH30]
MQNCMQAWTWAEPGQPTDLILRHLERPQPQAGEVLIENHAVGLNPVDWKFIDWGHPRWPDGHIPGVDGAGLVIATGAGVALPVGSRVAYHQSLFRDGSFASHSVLAADMVMRCWRTSRSSACKVCRCRHSPLMPYPRHCRR